MADNETSTYQKSVFAFHLIIVAPILLYVGYMGKDADEKVFIGLFILGIVVFMHHGVSLNFALAE